MQLIDSANSDVTSLSEYLQNAMGIDENSNSVLFESALIEDAVEFFARTLKSSNHYLLRKPLSCDNTDTWEHGQTVVNFMKTVSVILIAKNIPVKFQFLVCRVFIEG